jgi:hypothetical protein
MRRMRLLLPLLAASLSVTIAGSAPGPSDDEEANLRLLHEWRATDPARYDKVLRNFERFRSMTPEQQERLRELDSQLHDEDSATRARLMRTLEEYGAWLTKLPAADRQRVLGTADADERIKIIRELKEKQWFQQLPAVYRQQYQAAPDAEKKKLIAQWKQEEQKRREDRTEVRRWEVLTQERPFQMMADEGFRNELVDFVSNRLFPMLSTKEKETLKNLEEMRRGPMPWMPWMRAVENLSSAHPVLALKPKPTRKNELPDEYQQALDNLPSGADKTAVNRSEGKWPDYAIEVTKLLRSWKAPIKAQLGPSTAREISTKVSPWVDSTLVKALTEGERDKLKKAEGRWPEYPQTLHELARKHRLPIPDLSPPGEQSLWDFVKSFRTRPLPEPPEDLLRKFAQELNADRSGPPLSPNNPVDRENLKRKFFEKYPDMLVRLEQQDRTRGDRNKRRPDPNRAKDPND